MILECECGHTFRARGAAIGGAFRCPECDEVVIVPGEIPNIRPDPGPPVRPASAALRRLDRLARGALALVVLAGLSWWFRDSFRPAIEAGSAAVAAVGSFLAAVVWWARLLAILAVVALGLILVCAIVFMTMGD